MEFAIIQTGGKQYKVSPGDVIRIEKIKQDLAKGDVITFDSVLLTEKEGETVIGTPFVEGAKVKAIFEEAGRAQKIDVIKYKQKSRYFKKNGHRQPFFKIKIETIERS